VKTQRCKALPLEGEGWVGVLGVAGEGGAPTPNPSPPGRGEVSVVAGAGFEPTIPSSTSQRASLATRSTLSATVPSFSWKVMRWSFFAWSSSGVLRSWSQKKRASLSRAASTLRLPSTIAAPPSVASMLAVQTNASAKSSPSLLGEVAGTEGD